MPRQDARPDRVRRLGADAAFLARNQRGAKGRKGPGGEALPVLTVPRARRFVLRRHV
jgi:hypothetical protein